MARPVNKEAFLSKLPDNLRGLLRKEEDFAFVTGLWKLPQATIKTLTNSIPEKLQPIFEWKFKKPEGRRGKKSSLPFAADKVKLAGDLMKSKVGSLVTAEGGMTGKLLTVQVLAKLEVNGKTKTVSVNNIMKL